jgi:hypothetical protein
MAPKLKPILIYCVRCKEKTESRSVVKKLSANNRLCLSGICAVCNSKKNQFIAAKDKK